MGKALLQAVVISLLAFVAIQGLQKLKMLEHWEFATWNWRVRLFAEPAPATDKIKIILLDQASLDWGMRENGLSWPWPRQMYELLTAFCQRGGARLLAFDVLYTEPSFYGVEDDQIFAAGVAGMPVIMPVFLGKQTRQQSTWPETVKRNAIQINGLDKLPEHMRRAVTAKHAAFPVSELANAAAKLGHVHEEPDSDGIFRHFSLFRVFDKEILPSLGLAPLLATQPEQSPAVTETRFILGKQHLDMNSAAEVVLRFRGKSGTHEIFSAAEIIRSEILLREGELRPSINPAVFKNKYVFFGFSAPGLKDLRPTPVSGDYPGVEVHATLLDNLLQGDLMHSVPVRLNTVFILFSTFLATLAVLSCKRVFLTVIAFTVLAPLPSMVGILAYPQGYWWPIVAGQTAVILALVMAVMLNYVTEGRQKRFIKSAFSQYLSPDVIEQIVHDPSRLKLGGEKRELSILFSDVQGFTSISEKLTPEQLISLLNDYLCDMTDIIMSEGGTLDKYEGDAIIAFWNAPLNQPDHAIRICRTALRCQRQLDKRREEFYQRTGSILYARIGIHSGEVVVGNMGSKNRFDYTMLGDAANLASRLEGANKAFNTFTMVSEATWCQTGDAFIGREIGTLKVVGRKTPVTVYEPIGFKGEALPPEISVFNRGLAYCKQKQWHQAVLIFETLPADPVAQIYLKRCREIEESGTDWDGVWVLSEK